MDDVCRPGVKFLSPGQVELIVEQAYRTVQNVGVLVDNEEALELISAAGGRVGDDRRRVYISQDLCERCLKTVPETFRLFDRDGNEAFAVGGDSVHFDPGSAAPQIYDFGAREIRAPATRDVVDFITVTDSLPAYGAQSTGLIPKDVPELVADRYRLFLALVHGKKPVITGTFTKEAFATMQALLTVVRGDAESLRRRPLAVFDCCPTSPLGWSDLTAQALIDCARAGIPANLVPAPLIGATSPVTLAGTIVQHTAENLSGVVIHQTAAPGAPLVFGGAATLFDMRKGTAPMSAVEAVMANSGCVQVGKFLGMPTHSYMGLSDAKTLDVQAGFETTLGTTVAALSGVNIVSGAGLLNYALCQSLEKLVIDAEICAHAQRLIEGIAFREEDAGYHAIEENAPSSSFLTSEHTRGFFRKEVHYLDTVIDRLSLGDWEADGKTTGAERAHEKVRAILGAAEIEPLDGTIVGQLEELMASDAAASGLEELPQWRRGAS